MKSSPDSANLDVLRAVAVLCVLTAHLLHFSTGIHTTFQRHLGQLGVIMFFVHTSLVLMFSLERTRLRGQALFFSFYTRRVFRIFPLSMLCVLAVYFAHHRPDIPLLYSTWSLKELAANLTLTQNLFGTQGFLSVLWTLPLEVQMYIFLPLLFIGFRSRSVRPVLLLWLASIPVAVLQRHYAPRLNLLSFAPCFLAGIVAWRLHAPKRDRLPGWLWPLCIAAVSMLWFAGDLRHEMYFRWGFCLLLGSTIPFFAEISFAWVRAVANTIAKYSYGIYLTHTTAMTVGFLLLRNHFAQWSVFLGLAVALPLLMYHLVEHPGIQAGKRIANWLWNPPARTPRIDPKPQMPLEQGPMSESIHAA
jgi:peptidoglycan/LPS O-acetylase OafA/YrhL